jgi:hypothetical protein
MTTDTGTIVAFFSAVIASVALFSTIWQNILTRKAVQSQVLLSLKDNAREIEFFEGMEKIASLKTYVDYAAYMKGVSAANRKLIYEAVDFLNFIAHLVEDDLLPRQTAWNYYFHSYQTCYEKLLPWWLEGIRKEQFQGFTSFEKMCLKIGTISEEEIRKHESKQRRKSI